MTGRAVVNVCTSQGGDGQILLVDYNQFPPLGRPWETDFPY